MGVPKLGVPILGGLYNKDCSMLGSILGSSCFRKLPCGARLRYPGAWASACGVKV